MIDTRIGSANQSLAKLCNLLTVTTNPSVFIIGGGVSKAGEFLIDKIKDKYIELPPFGLGNKTEFELAKLGNDAGIYGGAFLIK